MFVGFSAAMHSGAPQIYLFRISTGAYFIDNNKKIKTADIYRIYGIFHYIIQVFDKHFLVIDQKRNILLHSSLSVKHLWWS